jgi:hypothetical protein
MEQFLSFITFTVVSLNVALDAGSRKGIVMRDRSSPIHCFWEIVCSLASFCYPEHHTGMTRPGSKSAESSEYTQEQVQRARHPHLQPLIRSLNVVAVAMFLASLCQHGHVWQKALLTNAMLCWLLRNITNQSAQALAPRMIWPTMRTALIFTFLEHVVMFTMTDYFRPTVLHCWIWLVTTYVPVAVLTSLLSRPIFEGQQDRQSEAVASLLHISSLGALWLFGFSPMAQRHFALHDPNTAVYRLDYLQITAVVVNTFALLCCIWQEKHRSEEQTRSSVVAALIYCSMIGFFYLVCYPLYQFETGTL